MLGINIMTEVTAENMSKIIAPEVDYKPALISNGTYIYSKIYQQTGGDTLTLNTSTGQTSVFELPPDVYNLAKSRLNYKLTPTASGANLQNAIFSDTIPEIKSIEFHDGAQAFPVRIEDVNKYLKTILRHETKLEEMLTNDVPFSGVDGVQTSGGVWEGLHQIEHNENSVALNVVAGADAAAIVADLNNNLLISKVRNDVIPGSPDVAEYKDNSAAYYVGANYADANKKRRLANSATPIITRNFPLSIFYNTLLAMNRDVYFGGKTMYLRIVWNDVAHCGFRYNSPKDINLSTGEANITGNITISNLGLFVALEANKEIEVKVKEMVLGGGFKMLFPYVWKESKAIAQDTNTHNIEYKINGAQGKRLLKLYWAPYRAGASGRLTYDHSNTTNYQGDYGTLFSRFDVKVNNERRSQYEYDCTLAQDYVFKKDKLKGSCIQDSRDYYANWTWIEDFTNNMSQLDKPSKPDEVNIIQGKDLSEEVKINITATRGAKDPGADIEHNVYSVVQRELMVGPGNIVMM